MRIQFEPIPEYYDVIDETETEIDEQERRDAPVDPRLPGLSAATRDVVATYFGGDVDLAIYAASKLVNNYRYPPRWALEVEGPRRGWRVFDKQSSN